MAELPKESEANRAKNLKLFVATELATLLDINTSDVDPEKSFTEAGIDSLLNVDFATGLSKAMGQKFLSTLTFDYPTVNAVVAVLLETIVWEVVEEVKTASLAGKARAKSKQSALVAKLSVDSEASRATHSMRVFLVRSQCWFFHDHRQFRTKLTRRCAG